MLPLLLVGRAEVLPLRLMQLLQRGRLEDVCVLQRGAFYAAEELATGRTQLGRHARTHATREYGLFVFINETTLDYGGVAKGRCCRLQHGTSANGISCFLIKSGL